MRDRAVVAVCAAGAAWGAARADWTYQVITPPGQSARAYGMSGAGVVIGSLGATAHASVWSSFSPPAAIDVNPSNATESNLVFSAGSQHVGNAVIGGVRQAGLWQGNTASSFVSLHPAGYTISYALGTDGTHQAGWGTTPIGQDHALYWSGSAASMVVLDPAGAVHAHAYQVGGGRQVGWAEFAPNYTTPVAGFWQGTPQSWTVLGVPEGFRDPLALCISPDGKEQCGQATGATGLNWAILWHGSTESFVSLHPSGFGGSSVLSTDGRFQAGATVQLGIGSRAALWQGSAESFVNLSALLPASYTIAEAWGVRSTATDVWVAGRAYNPTTNSNDAILWHNTIPAPGAGVILLAACVGRRGRRRPG